MVFSIDYATYQVAIESYYHKELNPHAPKLLLNVLLSSARLSTRMHNLVKGFTVLSDAKNPITKWNFNRDLFKYSE